MSFFIRHFGATNVRSHPSHGLILDFDVFCDQLLKNRSPADRPKYHKSNTVKTLTGYKGGNVLEDKDSDGNRESASERRENATLDESEFGGRRWIKIGPVLEYIFSNRKTAYCDKLSEDIELMFSEDICSDQGTAKSSTDTDTQPDSIFDLYKTIASTPFRGKELEELFMERCQLDDHNLKTLYHTHKDNFTEHEWLRVKYFEHHFASYKGHSKPEATPEKELESRVQYYKLLTEVAELSSGLEKTNKRTITSRTLRKELADNRMKMQINGTDLHLYSALDKDIVAELAMWFPDIKKAVTLPSDNPNQVQICISNEGVLSTNVKDVMTIISSCLDKEHQLNCKQLFVFEADCLQSYYREGPKTFARFILSDDIDMEKVTPLLQYTAVLEEESIDDLNCLRCNRCFPESQYKPLDVSNFQLVEEWILDVPLLVQLLFESSINLKSYNSSKDKLKFLKAKLLQLYILYDSMLHTSNFLYTGLLQQANSLELLMHSKSLKNVFQVANTSGIAASLRSAERFLDFNSADDILYYNTFLKGYPVTYRKDGKEVTEDVRLRDCIIILMLDNLVRLKFRNDPTPGEKRSKQMNTLPITLQGIPKVSDEVASWHLSSCVLADSKCPCKESEDISPEQLLPLTVTLLPEEDSAARKFSRLSTFGLPGLQQMLFKGTF